MTALTLDFLAGLAHELRTPLGAIGGYAELLELGVHGPVNKPQSDGLRRIRANQQIIIALIDAFMAYADTVAGNVERSREPNCASAVLADVMDEMREDMQRRAITTVVCREMASTEAVGNEGSDWVYANPVQLRMLFRELLMDALGSMQDGGTVRIELGEDEQHRLLLHVRSSGDPIALSAVDAVFRPFDREAKENRATAARDALSLPHACALARAMGGDLTAVPETAERVLLLSLPSMSGNDSAGR